METSQVITRGVSQEANSSSKKSHDHHKNVDVKRSTHLEHCIFGQLRWYGERRGEVIVVGERGEDRGGR